jgi:dsRNA-specific ribonuclease
LGVAFAYDFRDPALREQALRHRSTGARNNERLEFLGDALVGLFAAESMPAFRMRTKANSRAGAHAW